MIWRHLFGYAPASLVMALSSFTAVYAYTRLLGPEDYGRYSLALTTFNLAYTGVVTWAEAASYRFAGEAVARGQLPAHIRTSLLFCLSAGCLGMTLMLLSLPLASDPGARLALAVSAGMMIVAPIVNTSQEISRARQNVMRFAGNRIVQELATLTIGILLAWRTGFGPASPFVGMVLAALVLAIIEGSRLARESAGGRIEPARLPRYAAYGLPVAVSLLLNLVLDAGDRFLIAHFMGPGAVGVYAAGYGVADKTINAICNVAAMAGGPLMMAAYERDGPDAARVASGQLARMLLLLAAPAATGLAMVATPLSELLIGEALRTEAAHIMPWIAFSGLMAGFVGYYFSEAFLLSRRTDLRAAMMAIPALFNIAANWVLIPQMGLMGAVASTLAAYGLALVLLAVVGRRLQKLALPWRDALKVAVACAAMAGGLWGLSTLAPWLDSIPGLAVRVALGGAIYGAAVLALDAAGVRALVASRLQRR